MSATRGRATRDGRRRVIDAEVARERTVAEDGERVDAETGVFDLICRADIDGRRDIAVRWRGCGSGPGEYDGGREDRAGDECGEE